MFFFGDICFIACFIKIVRNEKPFSRRQDAQNVPGF